MLKIIRNEKDQQKKAISQEQTQAFTLMEIIIVVIILGVLMGIAIPRLTSSGEQIRASEGVHILTALLEGQKVYSFENDDTYTDNSLKLDITIPTPANFGAPTLATANPIASITRTNGYTLKTTDTGVITCTNNSGATYTCAQAGY